MQRPGVALCLVLLVSALAGGATKKHKKSEAPAPRPLGSAANAAIQKGAQLTNAGNLQAALDEFKRASQLQPDHGLPWLNMGIIYGASGNMQQAVESYQKSVTLDPTTVDGYRKLGTALMQVGLNHESLKTFQQAIRLAPDDAWLYYERGNVFQGISDYTHSIADFKQATPLFMRTSRVGTPTAPGHGPSALLGPKGAWSGVGRGSAADTLGRGPTSFLYYRVNVNRHLLCDC